MTRRPTALLIPCPSNSPVAGFRYRLWYRLFRTVQTARHRVGLHGWNHKPWAGVSLCEWCGASKPLGSARVYATPMSDNCQKSPSCCGDPANLDGALHPWVLVSEDGPGDVYQCPGCGAVDVD